MSEMIVYSIVNGHRARGLTDDEIVARTGYPRLVVRSVQLPAPAPSRQRSVQHMQLTKATEQLMPKVEAGDQDAIALLLKVHKREADLLGLDAPKEVISHNFEGPARDLSGMTVDELKRLAMEHIEATTIDVTPTRADEPAEPDPALARFRSARGSD